MANKIGVTFSPKRPFGFETHEPDVYQDLMVYDEEGNFIYRIEPATEQFRLNKSVKKFEISEDKIWLPTNNKPTKQEIDNKWDDNAEESVYGIVRQYMSSNINDVFNNVGTEQDYWDSYLKYETPLVSYLKSKLDL